MAATESINLAREGRARCRYCKTIKALEDVIAVFYRGNILFCSCEDCFAQYPIVMKRVVRDGKQAVYVGPLRPEDRPSDIVIAHGIPADLVNGARPRFRKVGG